jgi:hypothetical protein
MKFGIIVCPKCKMAKGTDLSNKTTRCIRCGKVLTIEKLKILYKTNSEQKIREAIGLVNAELNGKLKEFKKLIDK